MKALEFPEQTTVFAKNQPEYRPLPAHRFRDAEGRVAFCWGLTWRERLVVLATGKLWHVVLTFDEPLQPQQLSVDPPTMKRP